MAIGNVASETRPGSAAEVFWAFLRLGLTSFGGPIAHLGYFRNEFVARRRWVDEAAYADLVALCQFLPGPASSQVGFALGLLRAGPLGALAAWTAFTLPSALVLVLVASGAAAFDGPVGRGLLHGLKITAVAVVAQAVLGMARSLTPDRERAAIAVVAAVLVTLTGGALGQVAAIVAGGLLAGVLCPAADAPAAAALPAPVSRRAGTAALGLFLALLLALPLAASVLAWQGVALFDAFFRAGALVFGGGHVVLPLLEAALVQPGWVGGDAFLAGYGAAQAVPGPLFTFGAYLGFVMEPAPHGLTGAVLALVAIFLPGLLLVVGALPFWSVLRTRGDAQTVMRGANAAVVGLLAVALVHPIGTNAIADPLDAVLAAAAFLLLVAAGMPSWAVVLLTALAGLAVSLV
ncbi:chromate efflux transporter [Marinivivus vitaminiproducens]|uniref:chromate efflux transporter n=1 Tax=Marinivivus vitaminiproducens TaxID=3035935 RepID=UPI0027A2878C|nr:chromate efflux transporter [Geminicoccaceae bacterium SCSIO 64248]